MQGMMAKNELLPGTMNAALVVNERLSRVYGNALGQPLVTGVKLKTEDSAAVDGQCVGAVEGRTDDAVDGRERGGGWVGGGGICGERVAGVEPAGEVGLGEAGGLRVALIR